MNENDQPEFDLLASGEPWKAFVSTAAIRDKRLSLGARVLYADLCGHLSPDSPVAWPGHKRLAEHLGVTKRSIVRYVQELEKYGWVEVERRDNHSNRYTIYALPREKRLDEESSAGGGDTSAPVGDTSAPVGDTSAPVGDTGVTRNYNPLTELTKQHPPEENQLGQPPVAPDREVTSGDSVSHVSGDSGSPEPASPPPPGSGAPPSPLYGSDLYKQRHPGLTIFREMSGYWPDKDAVRQIRDGLGPEPGDEDLARWREVVREYVLNGGNPRAVGKMLGFWERGEVPFARQNGRVPEARSGMLS